MRRSLASTGVLSGLLTFAFLLSSCGAGSQPEALQQNPSGQFCMAGFVPRGLVSNSDPFVVRGKVAFDQSDELHLAQSSRLEAGTALAVTIKTDCRSNGLIPKPVGGLGLHSYTWRLEQPLTLNELRRAADADECVVGISEGKRYTIAALPNDPYAGDQQHLASLEASAAYDLLNLQTNLRPVTIAILDTGIDPDHADLRDVLWKNKKEIPNNGRDDDQNGYVDDVNGYNFADDVASPALTGDWSGNGHGTHVAGLAAAQGGNRIGITGVMGRGSRVMMLNIFGKDSGAYISDIANAIRYAADNGADVINMSIGGSGRSATYESALNYAIKKGVTVIVAAGNNATEIGGGVFQSPASYSPSFEGMLAVASSDSDDGRLSTYSNYSSKYVEIAAPGSEISRSRRGLLSTWPGGGYYRIQGTSMASPVVAGAAGLAIAMMRSLGYDPSPATIEGILNTSAIRNPALAAKVREGRALNLRTMAEFIRKNYPANTSRTRATDPGVPGYKPCGI
jgi:subtilisin family serine protease